MPPTTPGAVGPPDPPCSNVLSAVPWLCALVGSFFVPRLAGAGNRRGIVGALSLVIASLGIAGSASGEPLLGMRALCAGVAGFIRWAGF